MKAVIALVVVVFIMFALTIGPSGRAREVQRSCVTTPNPDHSVVYNGALYRRIRTDTPIFYGEIAYHLTPTVPTEILVEGKFRTSYVPWFDGILDPKYVNWRPIEGVSDLLFVDITADKIQVDPGYRYFDIYLKPSFGGQYVLPEFIQVFCAQNFPIGRREILPDQNGNFFPPASFDTKDLRNWQAGNLPDADRRPQDIRYYLFSYDPEGTPTWDLTLADAWPTADLTVSGAGGVIKHYKAHFVSYSAIQYIMLVEKNVPPGAEIVGYKYTFATPEFQPGAAFVAPTPPDARDNLQLETFQFPAVHAWGWWSPECKPAIYLYPEKKTDLHVTVRPKGYLTYTDPPYPAAGWRITAYPDGTIHSGEKTYPYLYYESKIRDDAFEKPMRGYVVSYAELPTLFTTLLPKLGLNEQETKDFKDYWEEVLPSAPYYFIGVMDREAIDRIEPLTISPKEDTIIRVRLYFEALEKKKKVLEPVFEKHERHGFVVSEWGGLVKVDKDHPFTCSQ